MMKLCGYVGNRATAAVNSWMNDDDDDNNNNNQICKAPECQKTSVALADRSSRAN